MTYETEGGGKRGLRERRDDETEITLRESIAMHVTASLATLETAAQHRVPRLQDYRQFFVDALQEGAAGPIRRFVFPPAVDAARLGRLVDVLERNGVELERITSPVTLHLTFDYFGNQPARRDLPAGTLVVDLAQPQGRVAKALLEFETPQDDAFLERQEQKRRRNEKRGEHAAKEDYEFYDFTAWALPLAFGVEAYWTGEGTPLPTQRLTEPWRPDPKPVPSAGDHRLPLYPGNRVRIPARAGVVERWLPGCGGHPPAACGRPARFRVARLLFAWDGTPAHSTRESPPGPKRGMSR
jgi:hypothetical protein